MVLFLFLEHVKASPCLRTLFCYSVWSTLSPYLAIADLSSVKSLSRVRLFSTPWTTAHQASLSLTNSRSPPKLMSIESVMRSNHLILCWLLIIFKKKLFIYFWLHRVFIAAHGLSLVAETSGLFCCRARALWHTGSVVVVLGLSCPVACGIFPYWGSNLCPCIARQIVNHWTIREALLII